MISHCSYSVAPVHPDRLGGPRPLPPKWVVLHTSEGGEGPDAAEQLAAFIGRPGDRPSSDGGRYGSSYHAVADTFMHVIRLVPDDRVAFSAPGANTEGLHICIPGRANQTREQWLEPVSASSISTVAGYLLDMNARYGIPAERLTVLDLQAGTRGYTDHAGIRDAFGRTTHYDVGPSFPWDFLTAELRRLRGGSPTPIPNPNRKVRNMYTIRVTRAGWPTLVDLVVAPDGVRWNENGHTSALDAAAGVPIVGEYVTKEQALGLLHDRKGIGAHPFDSPAYRDAELSAAWSA